MARAKSHIMFASSGPISSNYYLIRSWSQCTLISSYLDFNEFLSHQILIPILVSSDLNVNEMFGASDPDIN